MRGPVRRTPRLVPGKARRASRGLPSRDLGYFQLIEAMLVGFLLLGAVFLAIGFSAPPPPSATSGTEELEQVTWDAVASINDLFVHDTAFANSTLSRAVADAMAGNTTPLVRSMRQFFPPGSAFNIYLNNGFARTVLYEAREPQGQTVGISFPFEPRWSYVFTAPDLEVYDSAGTSTAMGVTLIPVFNSNLVRDAGTVLEAEVVGTQNWLPGRVEDAGATLEFREHAFSNVVQGGWEAGSDYPAASIWMSCKQESLGPPPTTTIVPCYGMDVSDEPDDGRKPERAGRILFTVHNYGAGEVPVGTELTIHFPVGLDVSNARPMKGSTDWTDVRLLGAGPNPQAVKATLNTALGQGEEARVRVNLNATDERYAFKIVSAQLSGAAASSSQFLLRVEAKTAGAYTGGDARVVLISGPQPAGSAGGPGEPTPFARWAVVMGMPFGDGSVSTAALQLPNGEGIIEDASFPADFATGEGAYAKGIFTDDMLEVTPDKVGWSTGAHEVYAYHFFEMQLEMATNGIYTQASPHFPQAGPRPVFEGYEPMPLRTQVEQGIWWREEPPRTDDMPGFGKGFITKGTVQNDVDSRLPYRNRLVEGTSEYVLADLVLDAEARQGALKDAVRSARLTPEPAIVPVGESVRIVLDAEDLATYLSETGGLDNVEMTTRVYPPWGLRDRIPVHTEVHEAGAGLLATAYDLEPVFLNDDGAQDVLVASGDGNVYGVNGLSGKLIPGATYTLPEAESLTMGASHIARGEAAGQNVFAIGTREGASRIYFLDHEVNAYSDTWSGDKPELGGETLAINATTDMNGDGVPEIFVTHVTTQGDANAAGGNTRLAIYDGATGAILPGWTELATPDESGSGAYSSPTLVHGKATEVGMGKVGPNALDGVFVNTGMTASITEPFNAEAAASDFMDSGTPEEYQAALEGATDLTVAFGLYDAGMVAATEDGRYAWNFTGGRFTRVLRADEVPTGGEWTGIVAGGGDGWVYGLSGQKAITPITGLEYAGITGWTDVAMSNEIEGYMVSPSGILAGTRDGWTTYKAYLKPIWDELQEKTTYRSKNFPGIRGVDALEADIGASDAQVSWWAGDKGLMLRSQDWLDSVDKLTTTGQLMNSLAVDPTGVTVTAGSLSTFDLSLVNFEDVLAVSADDAWFVGGGVNGTALGHKGYIVRALDGGATLMVTEVTCRNALLQQLAKPCHLHAVDSDGRRLWVTGENGVVLVQAVDGDATRVSFKNTASVFTSGAQNGKVRFDLVADKKVRIDKVSVTWTPNLNLDCMREVELAGKFLWDTSIGAPYVTGSYVAGCGAGLGAVLNTEGYDNSALNTQANNANYLKNTLQLRLGPFKQTTFPVSGYMTGAQLKSFADLLYVTITFSDSSQDVYVINVDKPVQSYQDETMQFKAPGNAGYTVPAQCFGPGDVECGPYYDVDVKLKIYGVPLTGIAFSGCYVDNDLTNTFTQPDYAYLAVGCDSVSPDDGRLTTAGAKAKGTLVAAVDPDAGNAMRTLPGSTAFVDDVVDGEFTNAEILYWDTDSSGTVTANDLTLTGGSAGTVVLANNANVGKALVALPFRPTYNDANGNGAFGTGDTAYLDNDDTKESSAYDVVVSGSTFGKVILEADLSKSLSGYVVGRYQEGGTTSVAQSSIVRASGSTWVATDPVPVITTLRGVSMSAQDPQNAIAVGVNDRVLVTRDAGLSWNDMPKIYDVASGAAARLHAVDFTHPDAPTIVGGEASGLHWVLDGYTEWGRATTRELAPGVGGIAKVGFDPAGLRISNGGSGIADVYIDLETVTGADDLGLALAASDLTPCFVDDDGDLALGPGEAAYFGVACGIVDINDVRIANPANGILGSQVRVTHVDYGDPTLDLPGTGAFRDADGDTQFGAGDTWYWDSDLSVTVSVNDLILSGANAGSTVDAATVGLGDALRPVALDLAYLDSDEGGSYDDGDRLYQDSDGSGAVSVGDVAFATPDFGVLATVGSWMRVYDPVNGWDDDECDAAGAIYVCVLPAAVDELRLRITLTTPMAGFSKYSPQLVGSLGIEAWMDASSTGAPDVAVAADLTDATLFTAGVETVDWDTDHGVLRLVAVHNPWVLRLGNPEGADYALIQGGGYGARVTDMALSPDGSTLYVGTGGIYKDGAVEGAVESGWDNTLYAIDVATGRLEAGWPLLQFAHPNDASSADPIQFVRADPNGAHVITDDNSAAAITLGADGPVAWYAADGAYDPEVHWSFDSRETARQAVVARIQEPQAPWELVVSVDTLDETDGTVLALDVGDMVKIWSVKPNEKGVFDFEYTVPLNGTYGAYVLETTISWDLSSDFEGEVQGEGGLLQTARVFNAFTVTPPTRKIMHSPTYNLEVITWMQDWG